MQDHLSVSEVSRVDGYNLDKKMKVDLTHHDGAEKRAEEVCSKYKLRWSEAERNKRFVIW